MKIKRLFDIISKKFESLISLRLKYLFFGSIVIGKGKLVIGKNVKIRRSKIFVEKGSSVIVGDFCSFNRVSIRLNGNIEMGEQNIFEQKGAPGLLRIVGKGNLKLGSFNRIRAKMWIRFNGIVEIGSYSNINERTEIRCDELVRIGSFTRISYDVIIWDTNTHNIYPSSERRKLIKDNFPILGVEYEKPKTQPVYIGNDCWISKDVAILKGVVLEDRCIVGYGTILIGVTVESNTTISLDIKTKQLRNRL